MITARFSPPGKTFSTDVHNRPVSGDQLKLRAGCGPEPAFGDHHEIRNCGERPSLSQPHRLAPTYCDVSVAECDRSLTLADCPHIPQRCT
jgi:hypothetical protein